jgi:hypothetical protein
MEIGTYSTYTFNIQVNWARAISIFLEGSGSEVAFQDGWRNKAQSQPGRGLIMQ